MKRNKIALILSSFALALSVGTFIGVNNTNKEYKEPEAAEAWDINVKPSVETTYYSAADGKTGSDLKSALAEFNKPTSPSYDWSRYEAADEAQDDSSSILCVYTRHNIGKSSHCGNYSWDKWNREHVYTQSKFPNSDKDNHNIFACEGQINNYRGNLKYAEVKNNGGTRVTVFGHTTDCYMITNSYFEPCDEAKGEIARACLYCTVYYGYDLSQIFDSEETALKWNANFPVTAREIYRNNVVQGLQGNRNPFIDRPSYAQAIYGGPTYQGVDPLDSEGQAWVSVSPKTASVIKGSTVTLTGTASDSSAITWTSSNTTVATVNASGVVTGVKAGTATITASATIDSEQYTDTATITVTEAKTLSYISISGEKTSFTVDDTFSFGGTVTAHYNDSTSANVTSSATFSGYDMSTAGNQTVTVSYTEGGITETTTYSISVTSSGGGGGGSGGTYEITYTDLPKTYQTGLEVYTAASGIKFQAYNCANYSSKMQFKASGGYLQTTEALQLKTLTINNRETNTLTVYGSNTAGSFSTTISGTNDVYDLTGYSFFKVIRPSSNAAYCSSLTIELASSEKTLSYILVNDEPSTVEYTVGECFDPTGLTITRYYSDNTDDTYSYADHEDEFSFDPSLTTPLAESDEFIEICYNDITCYLEISVKPVPVTLVSISVSGMTTEYYTGDSFSFDGVCTATYSNDSQEVVTPTSVTSPDMSVAGEKTITVSYTEDEITRTDTYNINVEDHIIPLEYSLTNNSPYINGIAYKMYMINTNKSSTNYFSGEMSTYYGKTITNGSSSAVSKIYFEESGNGQNMYFYIDNDETTDPQYLSVVKSGTHYNFSYSETEPQTKWIYQSTENYECITYTLDNIPFTFGNRDNYTNLDTVNLSQYPTNYKVDFVTFSGEGSKSFPLMMNSYITCDASGETTPTYSGYSWSLFALAYSKFCDVDKGDFVNADPDSSGSEIEQFVARYDYIVGKYKYTDFLNRSPALINYSGSYVFDITNGHTTVIITVVSSLVTLTFLGIVVTKKKRRFHQ